MVFFIRLFQDKKLMKYFSNLTTPIGYTHQFDGILVSIYLSSAKYNNRRSIIINVYRSIYSDICFCNFIFLHCHLEQQHLKTGGTQVHTAAHPLS